MTEEKYPTVLNCMQWKHHPLPHSLSHSPRLQGQPLLEVVLERYSQSEYMYRGISILFFLPKRQVLGSYNHFSTSWFFLN